MVRPMLNAEAMIRLIFGVIYQESVGAIHRPNVGENYGVKISRTVDRETDSKDLLHLLLPQIDAFGKTNFRFPFQT